MKIKYGLANSNQADNKEFLSLLDKMLRDAYIKGYNHGISGKVPHSCYWGVNESTGEVDNCMVCGEEYK